MQNLTVKPSNLAFFEFHLQDAISSFPNLKIVLDNQDIPYLKGILDVPNDLGEIVGSFLVEIHCSALFPFKFPIMFETGGDIPQDADWHKYANGSCCITVWPDELEKCKYGITLTDYINQYAIPYFANQIYRKHTGHYKNGEYAHNKPGVFQYYKSLIETNYNK